MATFDYYSLSKQQSIIEIYSASSLKSRGNGDDNGIIHIRGFITEDTVINTSSNWGQIQSGQFLESMNDAIAAGTKVINRFTSAELAQRQVTTIKGTMRTWESSGDFILPLTILVFAKNEQDDVRKIASTLLSACHPTTKSTSNEKVFTTLLTPRGYTPGKIDNQDGAFSIKIGKWLYIKPVMLLQSVSANFSKEIVYPNHTPLSVVLNLSFIASRILLANEIEDFFNV